MLTTMSTISLFLIVGTLGAAGREGSVCATSAATEAQVETVTAGVTVELLLVERIASRLEFEVKVTNGSKNAVLVVSNPIRVDGSSGAYLSVSENNPAQLELRFEVFAPPVYTIYAAKNRVTFLRLEPGTTHQEKVLVQTPLKDTKPPWGEWSNTQPIDLTNIQQVVARVGLLPDDPAIHAALENVRSPEGLEKVKTGPFQGKRLFEIQSVISSKIFKVRRVK